MMMLKNAFYTKLILLFCSIVFSGCSSVPEENKTKQTKTDMTICKEPRSQICTREYNPVCAKLQDGSVKTYSTGCTACSDAKVIGYRAKQCP